MENKKEPQKITITKDGPYVISGSIPLDKKYIELNNEGDPLNWKKGKDYPTQESCKLCRCGKSDNKPYCDGTHEKGFDGTETATKDPYLKQADKISGPELDLYDAPKLCSTARFCHRSKGIWNLTKHSDHPESKKIAIEESCICPSGRLTTSEDGKTMIEPKLEPSLSLVEDPQKGVSGPIHAKGGIILESSDGKNYETRNRITLCRCGKSKNKPFCDGSHITTKFNDGDENIKRG